MTKPIVLYIPAYYDTQKVKDNRLILTKTKSLLKEDVNQASYIASIEKIENYQCTLPEIGEEYRELASKFFHRDREKNWELPLKVNDCKVYTYNWDAKIYQFRIYWIVISASEMLQIAGVFEPQYSAFYKRGFMTYFPKTEIDLTFDFSTESTPDELFTCERVEIAVDELQELVDTERQKEEKARYLAENLKISQPNFYTVLQAELKEKEEVAIASFMCTDWNMYYDLFNPENFSDPDSTLAWEDNADVYEYYEKPYTDNSKVNIVCNEGAFQVTALENLYKNKEIAEQKILSFLEGYTFGKGGAYADAIHYRYAKIEIERLHKTTFTNQAFLKRNVCLVDIVFAENSDELKLYFTCSWDTEHGIYIFINENFTCRTE